MFSKLLIANRGEIAVRIARTCRELGVATVAVYSDADASARHVAAADEAVHLPGVAPAETYLNVGAILGVATTAGAEALHPGYGFLSENADAAEAVTGAGLAWIGPPADAVRAVGDKIRARAIARQAGVSVVPGTLEPVGSIEEVHAFGEANGYPIAIKAAGGGGGRGFRVAASPDDVEAALAGASREAVAYFGSADVYLERYLARPKHIEVQILAPRPGEAIWLGARECSLQRRHQKLVEETPPSRFLEVVPDMGRAAVAVADACGYANAGTVEFLVDEEGSFFFLEVNARLQVEHTITEAVTGLDLVACQLRIAAGEELGLTQTDVLPGGTHGPRGHAIECRINAEDPARRFLPQPGVIAAYREPAGPGVRIDSGFGAGDSIPPAYDSLIAKLVVWGETREEARRRMLRALDEFVIEGVATTIPAHMVLLDLPEFVDGSYSTRTVEEDAAGALAALAPHTRRAVPDADSTGDAVLMVAGTPVRLWHPAMAGSASAATRPGARGGSGAVTSPMHGTILKVMVSEGDPVEPGDGIAVLEAMKMETFIASDAPGTVTEVRVQPGDVVEAGEVIALVE